MKALKYKDQYIMEVLNREPMKYRDEKAIQVEMEWLIKEEGHDPNLFETVPYPYDA